MKNISRQKWLWVLSAVMGLAVVGIFASIYLFSVPKEEVTTFSMGSYVQQTVYGDKAADAAALAANAVALLEDKISWRKPEGDITALNLDAGGSWHQVDPGVYEILETAMDVAQKSGGAFDPSIAPLSWLWNFDDSPTAPPDDGLIQDMLGKIGYSAIGMDEKESSVLIRKTGYALDLGAVGKGAACDEVLRVYQEQKAKAGIVAVGGSVALYGDKPGGGKWSIAIRNPDGEGALGSLALTAGFISTSGSYEKTFDYQGKRYFHLLDPKTGYPAQSGLCSVTVVCDSGVLSDALSTACFVLGKEKSLPLLEQYGAQAVFVDENKHVTVTEGLQDSFTLTAGGYTADA